MHNVLKQMKNQFSIFCDFYSQFSSVFNRPKKKVQKWPKLQERCALLWKLFFSSRVLFCATFSFEILSILMHETSCMQKTQDIFAKLIQMLLLSEVRVLNPKACEVRLLAGEILISQFCRIYSILDFWRTCLICKNNLSNLWNSD